MVETHELRYTRPACGVVAGLARACKASFVRIGVAACALLKGKPGVLHVRFCSRICGRNRHMAFRAGHCRVRSSERELRRGVIKGRNRLPRGCGVAARTVGAELAAVLISVTTRAVPRKAEKRSIQILEQNAGARGNWDIRGFVALRASNACMAPGERETRLAVIESFAAGLPSNKREVNPVVFGVTAGAVLASGVRRHIHRVHSAALRHTLPDFRVALHAF